MAKLWINEFMEGTEVPVGALMQAPKEPPIATQVIDFSDGLHHESAAFNAATNFVEWTIDAIASVIIGATPVATTSNIRYPAGFVTFRGVPTGLGYKVSVITNT